MKKINPAHVTAKLPEVRRHLGRRVRRHRRQLGLTQEQFAERLNLSSNYIAHLERGSRGATLQTLLALALALGIPLHSLLEPLAD